MRDPYKGRRRAGTRWQRDSEAAGWSGTPPLHAFVRRRCKHVPTREYPGPALPGGLLGPSSVLLFRPSLCIRASNKSPPTHFLGIGNHGGVARGSSQHKSDATNSGTSFRSKVSRACDSLRATRGLAQCTASDPVHLARGAAFLARWAGDVQWVACSERSAILAVGSGPCAASCAISTHPVLAAGRAPLGSGQPHPNSVCQPKLFDPACRGMWPRSLRQRPGRGGVL